MTTTTTKRSMSTRRAPVPTLIELVQNTTEDLRKELRYSVKKTDFGMLCNHPFFVGLYHTNAQANYYYWERKRAAEQFRKKGNWTQYILTHERPYRLDALIEDGHKLTDKRYWQLLSHIWQQIENCWQYKRALSVLFHSDRPGKRWMMDADERKVFKGLPETLTVYRGCDRKDNQRNWSWTLSREKADWFANRFRCLRRKRFVAMGECCKSDALAYFSGRDEEEILVNPRKVKVLEILKPGRVKRVSKGEKIGE